MKKHMFIVNPKAGKGGRRFKKTLALITEFAGAMQEKNEVYITLSAAEADAKIKAESEEFESLIVYACGGDGTLNGCINGAAGLTNVAVTNFPCGTGNDFIKTFGRDNYKRFCDLRSLYRGTAYPMDVISCNERYGVNICSVGFDARIGADVHKYSGIPFIGGATGYVISLITNTFKGVAERFNIITSAGEFEDEYTLACACNGKYYGGGFNPVPEASPFDGEIEYLIIRGVPRRRVAGLVMKYAKGRYRDLGDIVTRVSGGEMTISSEKEFSVNIDGEIMRTSCAKFSVEKGAVNFVLPEGIGTAMF